MALSKPRHVSSYVEEMLQCSVCLDTIKEPHTLQNCLHSYCKECTDQLQHKQNNQPPGVKCPLCGQFSLEDEIRHNFFIKDLAEMHRSEQHENPKLCEQCKEDKQASWKCLDCRMILCESCKKGHLNIKILQGHRLVLLSEDTEMVVDQLVFCPIHKDKPIELYCEPCKLPICMKCKVTKHNSHDTETIEEVLDKIVPEIQENTKCIDEYITANQKSRKQIDDKIVEMKGAFEKCHKEVDTIVEDRINEIKATQKQLKDKLNQQQKNEVKKLEDIKDDLEKRQQEGENLKRVVLTSLDKARHATLLNELVQGGLQEKMKAITAKFQLKMECKMEMPKFEPNTVKWTKLKQEGLLGKCIMHITSLIIAMGDVMSMPNYIGARYWPGSFKQYCTKPLQQISEIRILDQSTRLAIIHDMIWTPLYNGKINLYNKTGQLKKTITIANPVSVEEAHNDNIFIACHSGSGLHVITDNNNPIMLCAGSFSDVCSFKDKMYALEYDQKSVIEFCDNVEVRNMQTIKWRQTKKIQLNAYEYPYYLDTILITHQKQDSNMKHFYVSSWDEHTIHQYNEQGQQIQQFGSRTGQGEGKLDNPLICGLDSQSHILVADFNQNKYKILDPESGQWSNTGIIGHKYVYDAKIDSDGSLWLAQYNRSFIITKHVQK